MFVFANKVIVAGKSFITSNSLICHEKIHLEVKEYTCKLCNIGFSVRSNLRAHEKKYHEGLRFYCSQCTKAFVTKCSLDRHEKIHAGVKEFSCTLCSSAFYTKKELTKHKRYHEMNQRSTITPEEIVEKAGKTAESLLPKKSEELYGREYEKFHSWMAENCIELINENVLFEYFEELSESFSPNSLWTKYSMLKKMLLLHENFDMGQYHKLGEYLKQESKGYESKKSKVLSGEHVLKFMYEAPNSSFLMVKVALLFGIFGGCRRQELVNMLVDHVEDRGSVIVVKIPPTKTDKKRVFTIIDDKEIHSFELIRKYVFLRPPNCSMRRFFLHYRDGCCVPKPVGKNTFGRISRTIAEYLGLSEIEKYTGHCLRKFSANLLADTGAITTTVEHPSELKSPADIEEVSTEQLATDEIVETAPKTTESLLPKKSEEVYGREYEKFHSWMRNNSVEITNETVLFKYFEELSESFSPNSLWTKYSMLKKMLLHHENFDMSKCQKLNDYLKQASKGYESKKSKVLSGQHALKFIYEAPNSSFLMVKVALLFGIFGGCRRQDLVNMLVDHVEDRGSVIVVKIPQTKIDKKRVFTIVDDKEMSSLELIREYVSLRPQDCSMRRFFLQYRNGCCTAQPVGKNTFGKISSIIAEYLGLSEANKYTGHCLRKISVDLLTDAWASRTATKHHNEWGVEEVVMKE